MLLKCLWVIRQTCKTRGKFPKKRDNLKPANINARILKYLLSRVKN